MFCNYCLLCKYNIVVGYIYVNVDDRLHVLVVDVGRKSQRCLQTDFIRSNPKWMILRLIIASVPYPCFRIFCNPGYGVFEIPRNWNLYSDFFTSRFSTLFLEWVAVTGTQCNRTYFVEISPTRHATCYIREENTSPTIYRHGLITFIYSFDKKPTGIFHN